MKAVVQRVAEASVEVDGETRSRVGQGLLVLCGFGKEDSELQLRPMAEKIVNLRIFPDEKGRFHYSVLDIEGGVLLVPQFTLYADTSKGRRPEFFAAKPPEKAAELFERFVAAVRETGIKEPGQGVFGAYMQVRLVNDGPVTITLEN